MHVFESIALCISDTTHSELQYAFVWESKDIKKPIVRLRDPKTLTEVERTALDI